MLNRWLVLILVLAFVLRVGFLLLAGVNAPLTGDELAYQQIAENVAAGRGLFQTNNPFFPGEPLYAWQAPLYPLLLGALYKVVGSSVPLAKFLTLLFSTATVLVVYDLARRVFRAVYADQTARRIALAAALLNAIYPGFLTLAHLLLSETLFIFFLLLAFLCAAHALDASEKRAGRWWWCAAAGAAWGLATLTRGLTLYFTPLFALWLGWCMWRAQAEPRRLREPALAALLLVAMTALFILPYTARNYAHFGQVVVLETKGGVNLWLGNSPYTPNEFIRNVWKVGVREPMLEALPPGELARDRAAYGLALAYLRAEPLTFFARMPAKFADFWGFERNLVDIAEATTRGQGWNSVSKLAADLVGIVGYVLLALAGAAGFLFAPDADPNASGAARFGSPAARWKILFGGFTLCFVALHLVIFGDGRFHLPLIPLFALYAGWLAVALWRWRDASFQRHVTRARVALWAAIALALLLIWAHEAWAAVMVLQLR